MDAKSTREGGPGRLRLRRSRPRATGHPHDLFLSLVGLCVGITLSLSDRQLWTLVLAGVSAVGLVVCWAMLQSSIPQRITVRGAMRPDPPRRPSR